MLRLYGLILPLLLAGCSGIGDRFVDHVTVGTFNIRWLSPKGYETPWVSPPRGDLEFDRLAQAIVECGADVIGIEETCADAAVMQLADALRQADPEAGWTCFADGGLMLRGHQRDGQPSVDMEVAILYKSALLRVTVDRKESWRFDLAYGDAKPGSFERDREPLLVHVQVRPERIQPAPGAEPLDFDLMVCHMKSLGGADYERLKTEEVGRFLSWWAKRRTDESADATTWARGVYDPDFVLAGDFNAPSAPGADDERGKVGHEIVWRIFQTPGLHRVKFANDEEPGTFILPPWQGTIDHVCLSDAAERQRTSPLTLFKLDERIRTDDLPRVKTEVYGETKTEPPISMLSDHRPVTVRFSPTEVP